MHHTTFRLLGLLSLLVPAALPAQVPALIDPSMAPVYEKTNPRRTLLSETEVATLIASLPAGWTARDGRLIKTFALPNYREAIAFVVAFSFDCEQLDHHADLTIIYNKVNVVLTSHDVQNQITTDDAELARRIEAAAARRQLK